MSPFSADPWSGPQSLLLRLGRSVGFAALAVIALVGADVAVGLYDVASSPATRVGGISAVPRTLTPGINTFPWSEPHTSSGIEFAVVGRRISQAEMDALLRGITGSVHVGRASAEGDLETLWEYAFRLDPQSPVQLPSVEHLVGLVEGQTPDAMSLGVRYDVTCLLRATADTQSSSRAFHSADLAADTRYEISVILDGDVPDGLLLAATYSRPPKSFLKGTLLGRVSGWLAPR